jgi:hypothetical protein
MTPERIQQIKDQISEMNDRELQNAILLKLTQVYEQQAQAAKDTKRAADNAKNLLTFFVALALLSLIGYLIIISEYG